MARVILEFDSDDMAQRFVDDTDGYVYWNVADGDWDSAGANIAEDSPIQPTPPKTREEQMRDRREGVQARQRENLARYVDQRSGVELKEPGF